MLAGERFSSNDEMFAKINAYFKVKDKSFIQKGIEMLSTGMIVSLLTRQSGFWPGLPVTIPQSVRPFFFPNTFFSSKRQWPYHSLTDQV